MSVVGHQKYDLSKAGHKISPRPGLDGKSILSMAGLEKIARPRDVKASMVGLYASELHKTEWAVGGVHRRH